MVFFILGPWNIAYKHLHYLQNTLWRGKPTSNYEFWCLVFLAKIKPTIFSSRNNLASAVQRKGIIKEDWSTTNITVSERKAKENKWKYCNRNLEMEKSISTREDSLKKALATNAHRVNDDDLQLGGALSRQLNHSNPHWQKKVTGSGVPCKLCWWDTG